MKDQLVEKLRAAISEEIVSECQVVYILAECRKLLDKYPPDKLPFALKIYCHWALHVDLTNPGTTGEFMEGVDRFVESALRAVGIFSRKTVCFARSHTGRHFVNNFSKF